MKVVRSFPELKDWVLEFRITYVEGTVKKKTLRLQEFLSTAKEGDTLTFRQDFTVFGNLYDEGTRTDDYMSTFVERIEKVMTNSKNDPWALLVTTETGHQFVIRLSQQWALRQLQPPIFQW